MPKKGKGPAKAVISSAKPTTDVKEPAISTGSPKDHEGWKTKNARAKELIMSTLIPGSEPWKIAEPLDNASDIWKALEAKYARKDLDDTPQQFSTSDVSTKNVGSPEARVASVDSNFDDHIQTQSKEVVADAVRQFYTSMPDPDQRILWALLHGGKPETNEWFYGDAGTTQVAPDKK